MRNLTPERNIWKSMKRFVVVLPVLVVAGTAWLFAQAPAAQSGADGGVTFRGGVQAVQAPVIVLDREGNVVNGLNATDFTLFDNGKPKPITEDLSSHPISLVVVVQANNQMEKIMKDIRPIGSLFDSLVIGEDGEMAVMQFDHRVQTIQNFTSDPDLIHKAFKEKLKTGSTTAAINDAVMGGINLLRNRDPHRKRIMIVIAEDRDGGSGISARDVLESAEFNNVVIYGIDISHMLGLVTAPVQQMGRPDTIPPGGQYLPNSQVMTPTLDTQMNNNGDWSPVLKEIFVAVKGIFKPTTYPLDVYAHFTGARQFPFFTEKQLQKAVAAIGNDLHNEYILTFSVSDEHVAGYHTIKVTVDKPDMKVYTREGYWLAAKPE